MTPRVCSSGRCTPYNVLSVLRMTTMARKRNSSCERSPRKRQKLPSEPMPWADWPAPSSAMSRARSFIREIVANGLSVIIVPDKDADGLCAGTIMYHTLRHLDHPEQKIHVHHLKKGNSVHSDEERSSMQAAGADRMIVLDQGSRPGRPLLPPVQGQPTPRVLIIDHHQSSEWPEESVVLTACKSPPIATAALLTYCLVQDLHPDIRDSQDWRAVTGLFGDLGPSEAKWGTPPWPSHLGQTVKRHGAKNISEAVAAINAPRRTAEYNVPKAWKIMLDASGPRDVASNAFLKLCKIDVRQETEKWARTAPQFSRDGTVAMISVDSGFQIHPVIATRWAGTLGKKSKNLVMVMCANTGFNPNPEKVSFSCRLSNTLRALPETDRPDLIALLRRYGESIPGFMESVGDDFARGHREATGGIINKTDFAQLLGAMQIGPRTSNSPKKTKAETAGPKINDFFRPLKQK